MFKNGKERIPKQVDLQVWTLREREAKIRRTVGQRNQNKVEGKVENYGKLREKY